MKNTTPQIPTTGQAIQSALTALESVRNGRTNDLDPHDIDTAIIGLQAIVARILAQRKYTAQLRARLKMMAARALKAAKQVAR